MRRLAVLWILALAACGGAESPGPAPTTPRTIVASPQTVWVQPGATGTLTFKVTGPTGAPLPGALVTFTIVDNPTAGSGAQGATLVTTSATTDANGACAARITAGLFTIFRVRATTAGQTGEVVVVVAAGVVGTVDVAPFFSTPSAAATVARSVEVLFFDNDACRSLSLRAPPQSPRGVLSVSAAGGVARYPAVSTSTPNAVLARALDGNGVARAIGCIDLPGASLVPGGVVQAPLPLVDSGPDPTGSYAATTALTIAPPLAAAATIAATWRDLTDCPLDPAQLWLDGTIDALGPGALGDALGALRGAPVAGADGAPTACRSAKTSGDNQTSVESLDAIVAGMFGSPVPAAFIQLAAAAEDAPHLFDELRLHSTLDVAQRAGGTLADLTVAHTLTSVTFVLPNVATTDVPLQPLGLPTLSVTTTATSAAGTLTIAQHGFTARLGTAARSAFGTLSLGSRGLPTDAYALVSTLAALAHTSDGALVGCEALDEVLCPRAGHAAGCAIAACAAGLAALAQRLDTSFEAADGADLDLYLAGTAPLIDTHDDGLAGRFGDLQVSAQAGSWSVDLRPIAGRRTLGAAWEAIRESN
ncbi:MAG TPA: hypothetical protein VH560_06025 [Polyangia bacterium]|nr:hypothetical protein [Polyangia bacterium]